MKKTIAIIVVLLVGTAGSLLARKSGFSPMVGYQNHWTIGTSRQMKDRESFTANQSFPAVGVDFVNSMAEMVESQTRFFWGTSTVSINQSVHSLYLSWGPAIFFMPFTQALNVYLQMGVAGMLRFDVEDDPKKQALQMFGRSTRIDLHGGVYGGFGVEYQVHSKIWLKTEVKFDAFITVHPHPFAGGISACVGPVFRLF